MLLLAWSRWSAACEPVALDAVRSAIDAPWDAVVAGDPARAHALVPALDRVVGCAAAPLSPADAARVHRDRAMEAQYTGDWAAAVGAAAAARRLDPEGAAAWAAALPAFAALQGAPRLPSTEDFGASLAAVVWVDGQSAPVRVVGEPSVVQVFGPDGRPLGGAWLDPRDPLPDWVVFPPVDCAGVVGVDELWPAAERAEQAWAALDVDGFESALRAVAAGLPCVDVRLGPRQAAAIHRLEGLRLYTHGADAGALRSFQEARALDPLYAPPSAVLPPGSTVAGLWDQAGRGAAPLWRMDRVEPPLALAVDGIPSDTRPAALPSIVQVFAPSGTVLWTRYVPAGAALPDLGPEVDAARRLARESWAPAVALYRDLADRRQALNRRLGLVVAGVAAWTGSAALFVDNTAAVGSWDDPRTPPARLDGLRQRANWTATSSSVLLVVGGGLLVGAAVER